MTHITGSGLPHPTSEPDTLRATFLASFVLILFVAVFAQLLGCPWRTWFPGAEGEKSLVGGVKASVYTFMSYLT